MRSKYFVFIFLLGMFSILAEEAKKDDVIIKGLQYNYPEMLIEKPSYVSLSFVLAEYYWHKMIPTFPDDKLEPLIELEESVKTLDNDLASIKDKDNRLKVLTKLIENMEKIFYWKMVKVPSASLIYLQEKKFQIPLSKWLRYLELMYILSPKDKNAVRYLNNIIILSLLTNKTNNALKYRDLIVFNFIKSPYIIDVELMIETLLFDHKTLKVKYAPFTRLSSHIKTKISHWHTQWRQFIKMITDDSLRVADVQKWHALFPTTKIANLDASIKKNFEMSLAHYLFLVLVKKDDIKKASSIYLEELKQDIWFYYYLETWGMLYYKQKNWELSAKLYLNMAERTIQHPELSNLTASIYLKYVSSSIPSGHKVAYSAFARFIKVINEKSEWGASPKRKNSMNLIKNIFYKYYLSLKKPDTFEDYVNGMFNFLPLFPSMDKSITATVYQDMGEYYQGLKQFQKASECYEFSAKATSEPKLQLTRYIKSVINAEWQLKWLPSQPAFLEKETLITLNPSQQRLISLYDIVLGGKDSYPERVSLNFNYGVLLLVSGQHKKASSRLNSLIVQNYQSEYSLRLAWRFLQLALQKKDWIFLSEISELYLQKNYLPFMYDKKQLIYVNHLAKIELIASSSDQPSIKIDKLLEFNKVNPSTPAMLELTLALAVNYQQLERYTEALIYYDRHLQLMPPDYPSRKKIILTLGNLNDNLLQLEKSADYYEQLFKEFPKDDSSLNMMLQAIQVREATKNYEKALENIEHLLKISGKEASYYEYLVKKANILGLSGKKEEGVVLYKSIFAEVVEPVKKVDIGVLAVEYCRKYDLDQEALGLIQQILTLSKDQKEKTWVQSVAKSHYHLGDIHLNQLYQYLKEMDISKARFADVTKRLVLIRSSFLKSATLFENQRMIALSYLKLADVFYRLNDLALKISISGQVVDQKQLSYIKEQSIYYIQKSVHVSSKTKLSLDEYAMLRRLQASILNIKSIDYYLFPPDRFILTKTLRKD